MEMETGMEGGSIHTTLSASQEKHVIGDGSSGYGERLVVQRRRAAFERGNGGCALSALFYWALSLFFPEEEEVKM